jgi:hypothetical protein
MAIECFAFFAVKLGCSAFAVLPAGLPFRASCCWNGMSVIKAAPFKAGLSFRHHMDGECQVGRLCVVLKCIILPR